MDNDRELAGRTPASSDPDTTGGPTPPLDPTSSILKALEVMEKDSVAIAESFTSLFASLRLALAEINICNASVMLLAGFKSLDSMDDVARWGATSDVYLCLTSYHVPYGSGYKLVLDAATKGNRYINSCLRLNEEMKGMENLAAQIKFLRKNVDSLDSAVNKILRLP